MNNLCVRMHWSTNNICTVVEELEMRSCIQRHHFYLRGRFAALSMQPVLYTIRRVWMGLDP